MSKDCSKCGAQNPETAKFCVACGNSLSQPTKCPKCNEKIEKNYKFCPKCGNSLSNPQGTSNIPYDQSLNLIRHLPQPQSQPQSVISQLVKEQFGLRASQTEEQLQRLSWRSPPYGFQEDFVNVDHNFPYAQKRRLENFRSDFLNFVHRNPPDYNKSLDILNKINHEFPGNSQVLFNIAVCYQKMGDQNKVFDYLVQAKSTNLRSTEVLQELLEISCTLQFWKTFLDTLSSYYYIAKYNHPQSHALLQYQLRFGFYENALVVLKELTVLSNYAGHSEISGYLILMGMRCLDESTKELFLKAVLNNPSDTQNLIFLLEPQVKNQESPEYRNGRIKEEEQFQTIIQSRIATETLPLYNLRQRYIQESKLSQAKKICEELAQIKQERKSHEYYLYEGYLAEVRRLIGLGSMKQAENLCWSVPLNDRTEEWQNLNKQILLYRKSYKPHNKVPLNKNKPQEIKNLNTASLPRTPVDNLMYKAQKLTTQNKLEEAILFLTRNREAFIQIPDQIRMNNLLGDSYLRLSQYDEARQSFEFVLTNAPTNQHKLAASFSLGVIHRKKGDYKAALDFLDRILSLEGLRKTQKESIQQLIRKIQRESQITQTNVEDKQARAQLDQELLLYSTRLLSLGRAFNEISPFLEIEIAQAKIEGLRQRIVEYKNFRMEDVEYLREEAAKFVRTHKPNQAAQYYLSVVKVLYALNRQDDNQVAEHLRNYCATKGDVCAVEHPNLDVARAYYAEVFRFVTNFVFRQRETFDPREKVPTQAEIALSSFLSTYHRSKEAFLRQADWAIFNLLEILRSHNETIIFGALRGLILLASYNPEIGQYLLVMANREPEILKNLCTAFAKMYNKLLSNGDQSFLEEMIDYGINHIREHTENLLSQFQLFQNNVGSFAQLREKTPAFLAWNPSFKDVGVDFLGTDSRYLERMKDILHTIEKYDAAVNFDDRESKYLTARQYINTLSDNLTESPTYWGRAYMQPLVQRWKELLEEDFTKREEQAMPELEIEAIERAALNSASGVSDIHIVIANRNGTRSAYGIKLSILQSPEASYTPVQEIYEIGTIRIGGEMSTIIQIHPNTKDERLTLTYQMSYEHKGQEIRDEERTIPVKLMRETFETFDNPYTLWANANIVKDERMFKGRDALVDDIIETLKKVDRNKTIVIHGQKRSGKSSILYHVARKLCDDVHANFLPIEFDLGQLPEKFDAAQFFQAILMELQRILPNIPNIPSYQDLAINPTVIFIDYFKKLNTLPEVGNRMPLLIIDEFTYLYAMIKVGSIGEHFMRAWKSIIEKHLFAVLLAGTDDMPEFIRENANAFAATELKYVGYLDETGAKALMVEPIWDHQKNTSRLQETAIKKMLQLTAGNPFYIQILMNQLVKYMNQEHISQAILADVNQVVEDYLSKVELSQAPVLFDNLVSFLSKPGEETKMEARVLQVIAYLTKYQDVAYKQSILQEFGNNEHESVEKVINHLLLRNVIKAQSGVQAYKIQVELFKLWLNEQMPYERRVAFRNPYIVGNPVHEQNFYGRKEEITRILQGIEHSSFVIDAQWRTGKTSLLYQILRQLERKESHEYEYIPAFITLDGCPEEAIWDKIGEGVFDAVKNYPKIDREALIKQISLDKTSGYKLRQFKDFILDLIVAVNGQLMRPPREKKEVKFVLLIDESQQINSYSGQTRSELRNLLSQEEKLKNYFSTIVVGCKIDLTSGQHSSPWANFLNPVSFGALSDSDIRSLIRDPLKKAYSERYHFESAAVEQILEYSQKIPYDTQVYCSLAFNELIAREENLITVDIIEAIKFKAEYEIYTATKGERGKL